MAVLPEQNGRPSSKRIPSFTGSDLTNHLLKDINYFSASPTDGSVSAVACTLG